MYQGPIHCFRTVLQKEGIAGIYRGAGAMLLRDVPGYCFYFIPYTFFCGWITPDGCISPNPSSIWLAGGVAGKPIFFRQHWKTRMGRFPGQITGWLRGHHILLVTRKGHGAERPFSPLTKFPSTTTALYNLPNFMEVTLSDLHRAQCQQERKHPVPSSPWMSHSSLRITLPAIRGSQDASSRGLQPVGCPPGGCAPYPCAAEAELTVTDLLFFPPCTPASKTGVCIPHHAYLCKVIPTPAPHFLAISKLQTPKCRSILSSGNDYKMLSPFLLQIDRALAHLDSFSKMPQHSHSSKQTLVCPTGTCIAVTH